MSDAFRADSTTRTDQLAQWALTYCPTVWAELLSIFTVSAIFGWSIEDGSVRMFLNRSF